MLRIITLLILSLIMLSCAHHSSTPPLNVPHNWPVHDAKYRNSAANLPCIAWWKQFNDPNLNLLIDRSLNYNNDIKVAVANIEAAQGELKRIQLNWLPEVVGNAGYSSFPYLGFPGVLLNVVPSYTLNIFKQIKEQQQAKYELKATQAMHNGIRLAIISQVSGNYFNYLSQREELALLDSLETDLSRLITITQTMYQGGLEAKTNVEKAKAERSLIQAKKKMVQQNIIISENTLHYLLDENPGKLLSAYRFQDLNGQQMIIGALPLNIIENRPDMEQARQEFYAANTRIGIAFSNLLPTVNLALARGEIAKTANGFQLGQAIHFNQAIGEMPILKASTYGQLMEAKGLNKAAYYRYSNTLRKVLKDVSTALSAHDLYTRRLDDALRAKEELNHAYQLNKALYQRGIISHLSLIEDKIKLDELSIEVNHHKLEQLMTIVALYQDLAAGYNYVPAVLKD